MATFVQRPRIGRWLLSLLGLITAAAIFAAVLSTVADRLVEESSVDPALLDLALLQGATGAGGMASVTPSTMTGQVVVASTERGRRRRDGRPVRRRQRHRARRQRGVRRHRHVHVRPVARRALPAARPRRRLRRAVVPGLADVRRRHRHRRGRREQDGGGPSGLQAQTPSSKVELEDIEIGGRPGSIEGEVVAPDPTGAVAKLVVRGVADPDGNALVDEATVSADGSFQFTDVPSPGNYELDRRQGGVRHAVARDQARRGRGARGDHGRAPRGRRRRSPGA